MEFRILGPLEVIEDGRVLTPRGRLQRALLALLLLNANHVVTPNRLIDELWEDEPPDSARHALHMHVSVLRKALEEGGSPPTIVTMPTGYEARVTQEQYDLLRFERLVHEGRRALATGDIATAATTLGNALSLWRGPALADLSPQFFAQRESARLEESRLAALEDRIEADLLLGKHARIIPELQGLVRDLTLRERLRGQLVLALYRSLRQADALQVAREGRELLAKELGIDPGHELQDLERRVLRQDSALDWVPRDVVGSPALTAAAAPPSRDVLAPLADGAVTESMESPAADAARTPTRRWMTGAIVLAAIALVPVMVFLLPRGASKGAAPPPASPMKVVPNSLVGLDPVTLEVTDVIPIPGGVGTRVPGERQSGPIPALQEYVLVGAGPLTPPATGTCCGTPREVALVGTVSHRVKVFASTGQVHGLGFGHAAIWIADCQAGRLTAYQGNTQTSGLNGIGTVPLGNCVEVVGFDNGDIWAAELSPGVGGYAHDIIDRIDPRTMAIKARIRVLSQTSDMAFGAGSVWIVEDGNDSNSFVYRISERTNRVVHRFLFPAMLPWPTLSVAYGFGSAWVSGATSLYRIDPFTDSVRRFEIAAAAHDLASLAVGAGAVWADDSAAGTLFKIDPATGRVIGTKDLGFKTYGLLPYGGKVWVAIGDSLG